MKKNGLLLSGLMFIAVLLVVFSQAKPVTSSGKYHPKSPANAQYHTVTVLNPALFHRLNTVLELGLINGE